ncbi:hypothetical protein ACFONL_01530 [Camelimonas fluminis]|uniref:Uncharacterized protein n=1 Tax=Camelimonas fluminis TaxID=1576911 RepID=A0ABV7UC44_9HYPH|nr:hypothetical protein [Camelimonas fluminis]
MRTSTANLDPIATMGLEAVPFMPRGQFLAMLRRTGELAPETPEQRKARRHARATATTQRTTTDRTPAQNAKRRAIARYYAIKKATQKQAA